MLLSWFFRIIKTHVACWVSRSYLTGVTAAELPWHLSNMDVIEESDRYFCKSENFSYREINEQNISNPHLCTGPQCCVYKKNVTLLCIQLFSRAFSAFTWCFSGNACNYKSIMSFVGYFSLAFHSIIVMFNLEMLQCFKYQEFLYLIWLQWYFYAVKLAR